MEQQANSVWLWLSDEDNWERFGADDIAQIEHTIAIGNKGLVLERNYNIYFLDLLRLTQTSACTGRRRPIYQVKRGSSWLARDSPSDPWESFSRAEERDLEKAFFEGNECCILQRGDEAHYVDFMKWTVTDLSTDFTRHMKAGDEAEHFAEPDETMIRASIKSSGTSTIANTVASASTTSTRMEKEAAKNHVVKQQAKSPQDEVYYDDGDCTVTTVPVEYDSSHSSNEIPIFGKPLRRSISRRTRPSWRWEDDGASWSLFDDETAAAIERSWEFGAPEMMFERSSVAYFVDLVNLTQTNINTGNTRAIQRVEEL